MSRWSSDPDELKRRIYQGLVVAEYGPDDVDALEYIGGQA